MGVNMDYKTTQTKTMHDYSMKRILKAPETDITKPYRDVTDEQFKEFVLATEKELNRIFTEEYAQDPESVAERAVYHTNELRTKILGVEKI